MDHWIMYIFQYSVGGIIFLLGMLLSLFSKDKAVKDQYYRFYFIILIFGFVAYATAHGLWIYVSI